MGMGMGWVWISGQGKLPLTAGFSTLEGAGGGAFGALGFGLFGHFPYQSETDAGTAVVGCKSIT